MAELQRVLDVAARERREEERRVVTLAWATASLTRVKRMPPLKRLLKPFAEPVQPLTPQEAAVRQAEYDDAVTRFNAAMGKGAGK